MRLTREHCRAWWRAGLASLLAVTLCTPGLAMADDDEHDRDGSSFRIKEAKWKADDQRLRVEGRGRNDRRVTVVNAFDTGQVLGSDKVDDDEWKVRARRPAPIPCRIKVMQSDGQNAERDVEHAPADCAPKAPGEPPPPPPAPVVPDISINDVSVGEGAGSAVFTVSLSAATTQTVSVAFATANGSASAGSDYTATSGTLSFPAGATSRTISVAIIDDNADEPNETFRVNLSNASNGNIADGRGIGTIVDNDAAPPPPVVPNIRINDASVDEGAGNAVFTVSLSAATTQAVSVDFATANETATAGSDYTATSGTLSYPAGATSRTVSVAIIDDNVDEPDETFRVNLSNPSNANIADGRGIGTIVDNDAPAPVPNVAPTCTIDTPAGNVSITTGESVNFTGTATDSDGTIASHSWSFPGGTPASASIQDPGAVAYDSAGTFTASFTATDNDGASCSPATRTITVADAPPPPPVALPGPVNEQNNTGLLGRDQGSHVLVGANDLGMHCADQDDSIFSVLPPFNILHAQVIERGIIPRILNGTQAQVTYSAAANPNDPVGPDSINSTSVNFPIGATTALQVYKTNFWRINQATGNPQGFDTYAPLFFGLLSPAALVLDVGLPAPETTLLTACLPPPLGSGAADGSDCRFEQQAMPGVANPYLANDPQALHFDADTGFFNDLLGSANSIAGVANQPLGAVITNVNWFRADGIPILPVDDSGRGNAYPLVRVQAKVNGAAVASTDIVLPVAAEADCQLCHAAPLDCADTSLPQEIQSNQCNGIAVSPTQVSNTSFTVETIDTAPGDTPEQRLLNAAKINVLRLHDAKHGTNLDTTRNVVCAGCHYSPALDLAQVGPQGSQAGMISMSRAMHGHHGDLRVNGQLVFPNMPPPDQRLPGEQANILNQTCYQCHPGKRTQCLRGAMGGAGIVCQDCHGNMTQVGNDFTRGGPRVSWASEPKCQSCHTGDVRSLNRPGDTIVAPDGIRLLQAYPRSQHVSNGGDALPILSPNSRFAENETLYRLSGNNDGSGKGHGGIMCEGCHGSTHAIWPNANPNANDNVAAGQLQGHAGTVIECSTCHTNLDALGTDGSTGSLRGPHGMHPVGNTSFGDGGHRRNINKNACRACHGNNGEGTVLSRTAADRRVAGQSLPKGHQVGCTECHGNQL